MQIKVLAGPADHDALQSISFVSGCGIVAEYNVEMNLMAAIKAKMALFSSSVVQGMCLYSVYSWLLTIPRLQSRWSGYARVYPNTVPNTGPKME